MLAKPRQALAEANQLICPAWDPRLSVAGNRFSKQLARLLDQLARMESWLNQQSRAELRACDRLALSPPWTRRPLRGLRRRRRRTHPGPECPTAHRPGKMGRAATGASPGTAGRSAVVTRPAADYRTFFSEDLPHVETTPPTTPADADRSAAAPSADADAGPPPSVCLLEQFDYLGDAPLALAFLDRLVDRAIILKIKGKSYRASRSIKSPEPFSGLTPRFRIRRCAKHVPRPGDAACCILCLHRAPAPPCNRLAAHSQREKRPPLPEGNRRRGESGPRAPRGR